MLALYGIQSYAFGGRTDITALCNSYVQNQGEKGDKPSKIDEVLIASLKEGYATKDECEKVRPFLKNLILHFMRDINAHGKPRSVKATYTCKFHPLVFESTITAETPEAFLEKLVESKTKLVPKSSIWQVKVNNLFRLRTWLGAMIQEQDEEFKAPSINGKSVKDLKKEWNAKPSFYDRHQYLLKYVSEDGGFTKQLWDAMKQGQGRDITLNMQPQQGKPLAVLVYSMVQEAEKKLRAKQKTDDKEKEVSLLHWLQPETVKIDITRSMFGSPTPLEFHIGDRPRETKVAPKTPAKQ